MKCLVTGGAGFIGSHLAKKLHDDGHYVLIIDDLSTGNMDNINWTECDKFIKVDLTNMHALTHFLKYYTDIDWVFHLAARPRVQLSVDEPIMTNAANITATLNILVAARDTGVKRFIYSSSSSLYGDQEILPLLEGMRPNPLSPYALQKLTGEIYTKQFYDIYKFSTISLRYFNVYGPRQEPDSAYAAAIPQFTKQLLSGESPTVFGDGLQTRDFTYIDDVVRANILAAESGCDALGESFNIGGGNNISVNDVIKYIQDYLGTSIESKHLDPVIESKHTLADISKAFRLLNWSPQIKFNEGIKLTIESLKED